LAVVGHRLAHRIDPAGERRIRHDAAAPDGGDQVVLAHDAVAVLHQIQQEIEHLRLDLDQLGAPAQLPPVDVKQMIFKTKWHGVGLPATPSRKGRDSIARRSPAHPVTPPSMRRGAARVGAAARRLLAHVPAKWTPVRRQEHAQMNESRAYSDSKGTEYALT